MIANKNPTACVLIIGNEILSGRTKDVNLNFIATRLTELGIRLMEGRVIPDLSDVIVDTVNNCRARYDYVFTTGGIGPTHDDITAECIAEAFGVGLVKHPEARRLIAAMCEKNGVELNEARLRMANVPEGGILVNNPISGAPGFKMENVFVLAGVPRIMRDMFAGCEIHLEGGNKVKSKTVVAYLAEGVIAAAKDMGLTLPLVVRLQGTNSAEGRKLLEESGLNITPAETLQEAGERAVAAAKGVV